MATVVLPTTEGATLRIRKASTPEPQHRDLYRLLGISDPVMRPRKVWSDP